MASNISEAKEKKGVLARISRSLKDMRGEMKRVVWPTRNQVINNTVIVIGFMLLSAVVIGGFDTILSAIIRAVFNAS